MCDVAVAETKRPADWDIGLIGSRSNMGRAVKGFLAPLTAAATLHIMGDMFRLRDGTRLKGHIVMTNWGDISTRRLRCIQVPVPIAIAVASGAWGRLMFSAHSLVRRPRLFTSPLWPLSQFWSNAKTKKFVEHLVIDNPELERGHVSKTLRCIANLTSRNSIGRGQFRVMTWFWQKRGGPSQREYAGMGAGDSDARFD